MSDVVLPVGIKSDIDECFCYMDDTTYQQRAHEYLERYEVYRAIGDTAVQATVIDLTKRAFSEGVAAGKRLAGGGARHKAAVCDAALSEFMESGDQVRELTGIAFQSSVGLRNKLVEIVEEMGYDADVFIRGDRVFVMRGE